MNAPGPPRGVRLAAIVLGAVVGGLLGATVYELVAPVLDRRTDALRDVQGLVWNLVPALAVVGALVAARLTRPGA